MKALLSTALACIALTATGYANDILVSQADNGKTITMGLDQCLVLDLYGRNGNGYSWLMTPDSTRLLSLYGRSITARPLPGAKQTVSFSFCPGEEKQTGSGQLKFTYQRPGQIAVPPEKTFEITIKITP